MAGLAEDPGLFRSLHAAIVRNPVVTDERFVDRRDVSIFRQFQHSWARDEAYLTAHWWKLSDSKQQKSLTDGQNPWAGDSDRFLRESDKYGEFSGPATALAQSSVHALATRLEMTKRESDSLRNDLRKANERLDDYHGRFHTLRDENEQLRKTSSQYNTDRSEMSRVLKERQVMRDRIRELEAATQRLSTQLARHNTKDALNQQSTEDKSTTTMTRQHKRPQSSDVLGSAWISDEYQQLMTQDWLRATNAFEQFSTCLAVTDQVKCEILSSILVNACERAEQVLADLKLSIRRLLHRATSVGELQTTPRDSFLGTPRIDEDLLSLDKQNVNDELSEHFEQALSRELKRHAENIDVRSWVKPILGETLQKQHALSYAAKLDIMRSSKILTYVERACVLAWQMTIQLPMMYATCDGIARPCDPRRHELTSTDSTYVGANVLYFKRPTLYQGDEVLIRGKVQTVNHLGKRF